MLFLVQHVMLWVPINNLLRGKTSVEVSKSDPSSDVHRSLQTKYNRLIFQPVLLRSFSNTKKSSLPDLSKNCVQQVLWSKPVSMTAFLFGRQVNSENIHLKIKI